MTSRHDLDSKVKILKFKRKLKHILVINIVYILIHSFWHGKLSTKIQNFFFTTSKILIFYVRRKKSEGNYAGAVDTDDSTENFFKKSDEISM